MPRDASFDAGYVNGGPTGRVTAVCFSAEADFASAAVIGAVGAATLAKARTPREVPLAAMPLAFALHQLVEGFVWRDLDARPGPASGTAVTLYLLFAWVVLPVLAPTAILLVEPPGPRRWRLAPFVVLGAFAGAYLAGPVLTGDVSARAVHHTIEYGGAGKYADIATVCYVVATCVPPLLSGYRAIVWFGVANAFAVAVVATIQTEYLTSVWCLWAAIVSVLIFVQFRQWRMGDARRDALLTST
jgi:hypothetical protein